MPRPVTAADRVSRRTRLSACRVNLSVGVRRVKQSAAVCVWSSLQQSNRVRGVNVVPGCSGYKEAARNADPSGSLLDGVATTESDAEETGLAAGEEQRGVQAFVSDAIAMGVG